MPLPDSFSRQIPTFWVIFMFLLTSFFLALVRLINLVLTLYMYIVIARALISWVNPDPYNPVVRFLRQVTDPVLDRMRRFIPPMGGLDLTPMILILIVVFVQSFLDVMVAQVGVR